MSDAPPYVVIAAALGAGFVWGKLSSLLPIPSLLRLLMTPLWTGTLTVIAAWFESVAAHEWEAARVVDAARLGLVAFVRLQLGYGLVCFLMGAVLGFPATLGWAVGYREPRKP